SQVAAVGPPCTAPGRPPEAAPTCSPRDAQVTPPGSLGYRPCGRLPNSLARYLLRCGPHRFTFGFQFEVELVLCRRRQDGPTLIVTSELTEGGTSIHDCWHRQVVQRRQGLRLHPA